MSSIKIPPTLRPSTGGAKTLDIPGETLNEIFENLFARYPALREQILTSDGAFSRFINVYVDDQDARYLNGLQTPVQQTSVITLLPAMAGGS